MDEYRFVTEDEFKDACMAAANDVRRDCTSALGGIGLAGTERFGRLAVDALALQCLELWREYSGDLGLVEHLNRVNTVEDGGGVSPCIRDAEGLRDALRFAALEYGASIRRMACSAALADSARTNFHNCLSRALFAEGRTAPGNEVYAESELPVMPDSPLAEEREIHLWETYGAWSVGEITPAYVWECLGDEVPGLEACREIALDASEALASSGWMIDQMNDSVRAAFGLWHERGESRVPVEGAGPQTFGR